jgi:putative tricarboxylic transport membrane protein
MSLERSTFLIGFCVAALLLWQAISLDAWSVIGPGPGLFPMLTTGFCCVVAALLFCFPRLARSPLDTEREREPPLAPGERRTFITYCVALPLLAVMSVYLGFFVTSFILVMGLTWLAERRDWRSALSFALLCGIIGVVGFGHFLGASLPATEIDDFLLRLVR